MLRPGLLSVAATAFVGVSAAFAQDPPAPPAPSPVPATSAQPVTPVPPVETVVPAQPAAPARVVAAATPAQANNIIDVLTAQGNFTTLLAALDRARLTETLKSRPAVSIFAPTDEAFAALPEAERTRLMDPANAAELRNVLLYHVIVADVSSAQIRGARGGVETASRAKVLLDGTGEGLRVDGAMVTRADIDASNGAVFAIDKVLNPAQSMAAVGDEEAAAEEAPAATPPTLPAENPAVPNTAPTPGSGVTQTTRPATGETAPTGQPAATTTTVQSPPVRNPTDGQVDDEEDPQNPAPTPRAD